MKGLRRRHGRASSGRETRYSFSIYGKSPGWGHESGWTFGATPEAAARNALADTRKFGPVKWKAPAEVYLKSVADFADKDAPTVYETFRVEAGDNLTHVRTS